MTPTAAVRSVLGDYVSEARCREVVIAVLRACREPSEGMIEDAAVADVPWEYEDARTGRVITGPFALELSGPGKLERAGNVAAALYTTMIDALIEEVTAEAGPTSRTP